MFAADAKNGLLEANGAHLSTIRLENAALGADTKHSILEASRALLSTIRLENDIVAVDSNKLRVVDICLRFVTRPLLQPAGK